MALWLMIGGYLVVIAQFGAWGIAAAAAHLVVMMLCAPR